MILLNLIAAARDAIVERYRRRTAYEELMSLDDRSLADIGVNRSEIHSIVYGQLPSEAALPAEQPAMPGRGHANLAAYGD